MTEYVCGFMMDQSRVAVIKKARPAWQKDSFNGIGGHIELGESPATAMVREFKEETGRSTFITQWWMFAVLTGEDFKVHFFSTYGELEGLETLTDEEVVVKSISEINANNSIPNLTWLIPMARSIPHENTTTFHIQEEY